MNIPLTPLPIPHRALLRILPVLALALGAGAADITARIDVDATASDITLTDARLGQGLPGYANHATWFSTQDKNDGYLAANFGVPATDWTEVSFAFTPSASGKAKLLLKGPWKKSEESGNHSELIITSFDEVRCEGAELANGGFEDRATVPDELCKGWSGAVKEGYPRLVDGYKLAKKGGKSVAVSHDHPLITHLQLKAGQTVVIKAWVKAGAAGP